MTIRLHSLLEGVDDLLEYAARARDLMLTAEDLRTLSEKYSVCEDKFWTLRELAEESDGLCADLDIAISSVEVERDNILNLGNRMTKKR